LEGQLREIWQAMSDIQPSYLTIYKSLFIISAGSNDYINNYLQPQFYDTSKLYKPKSFAEHLIEIFSQELKVRTRLL